MQRRARTFLTSAALAVAVAGGLAGCTGSDGSDGEGQGTTSGDATATVDPAPSGKYATLPEPCGAVSRDLLKEMLPGADKAATDSGDDISGTPSPSPYEGEPTVTFDTDRRVGCSWQSTTSLGSRSLTVDFERVVSYDSEISDDERAGMLYDERATRAGVTSSASPADGEDTTEAGADAGADPDGTQGGTGDDDGGTASSDPGDELATPSPEPSLPDRTLNGIGEEAFIHDQLAGGTSDPGTQRDIRLVFRTSNVLVTVEYGQSIADTRRTPDSEELQDHAQNLARQLAGQLDDI